jgi:mannose-6-phosphate isomerase-like protein (cupin superfamily)
MEKSVSLTEVVSENEKARRLAEHVLSMPAVTSAGLYARDLARDVLGIPMNGKGSQEVFIFTNGTMRIVAADEPLFLLRAKDALAPATVEHWIKGAEFNGASSETIEAARIQSWKMRDWGRLNGTKLPDWPPLAR